MATHNAPVPDAHTLHRCGFPTGAREDPRCLQLTLRRVEGLPGLIFHDLRRSLVRNMIRRGVLQKTAREISGHKTDAVFSRYNIVSEDDVRDAARKLEAEAKVVIHSSFTVAQCSSPAKSEDGQKPS